MAASTPMVLRTNGANTSLDTSATEMCERRRPVRFLVVFFLPTRRAFSVCKHALAARDRLFTGLWVEVSLRDNRNRLSIGRDGLALPIRRKLDLGVELGRGKVLAELN
jgi:hypothetical protein